MLPELLNSELRGIEATESEVFEDEVRLYI